MSPSAAALWLKTAAATLMIAFGLMVAIAAWPPASGLTLFFADALIWPLDGAQTLAATETRLMMAIGGGITAGWGVMIWQMATHVLPTQPALARKLLLPAMLFWFIADSTCSVLAGVPLNAVVNAGFLAVFLWPVLRVGSSKEVARMTR